MKKILILGLLYLFPVFTLFGSSKSELISSSELRIENRDYLLLLMSHELERNNVSIREYYIEKVGLDEGRLIQNNEKPAIIWNYLEQLNVGLYESNLLFSEIVSDNLNGNAYLILVNRFQFNLHLNVFKLVPNSDINLKAEIFASQLQNDSGKVSLPQVTKFAMAQITSGKMRHKQSENEKSLKPIFDQQPIDSIKSLAATTDGKKIDIYFGPHQANLFNLSLSLDLETRRWKKL